jgi:hypothetical protein
MKRVVWHYYYSEFHFFNLWELIGNYAEEDVDKNSKHRVFGLPQLFGAAFVTVYAPFGVESMVLLYDITIVIPKTSSFSKKPEPHKALCNLNSKFIFQIILSN